MLTCPEARDPHGRAARSALLSSAIHSVVLLGTELLLILKVISCTIFSQKPIKSGYAGGDSSIGNALYLKANEVK